MRKKNPAAFRKGHKVNEGKKNACKFTKLKELGLLEEAYKSYCEHVAAGNSSWSWYFEHPKIKVAHESFESYFEKFPEEFEEVERKIAWSKGFRQWEQKLYKDAYTPSKETNPAIMQIIFRNRYGWDTKTENNAKVPDKFDTLLKIIKKVDDDWQEV